MARRRHRRRSFRGTLDQHRKQAGQHAVQARDWLRDASKVLREARNANEIKQARLCREAIDLLVGGARHQARYDEERIWARGFRRRVPPGQRQIKRVSSELYAVCVARR